MTEPTRTSMSCCRTWLKAIVFDRVCEELGAALCAAEHASCAGATSGTHSERLVRDTFRADSGGGGRLVDNSAFFHLLYLL